MNAHDDDEITRELLKAAGPPPPIPAEDFAAIRDAARATWQRVVLSEAKEASRRRMRWVLPLAASFVLAVAVAAWVATRSPAPDRVVPSVVVARVERVSGSVSLAPGQSLSSGSVIETTGRTALRWVGGQSLRFDAATRVRLMSPSLVELERGAIYVDSSSHDDLSIRTAAGDFTPAGTQFEVRVDGGTTRLRVREGSVSVAGRHHSDIAAAGEELVIGGGGTVSRARIRPDSPAWQWAVETAKTPPIEGRTLEWFLRWIAREKGWSVTFATPAAAALGSTTILHGSVEDLSLDEALRTVALSSGIDYRVRDGVLIVSVN